MDMKDLEVRLEVIKLLATIGDKEGIEHQSSALKAYGDPQIDEIVTLLDGNNIRQALYLIKNYKIEHFSGESFANLNDDQEVVLGVEDMLRMSPLAKETLSEYRAQAYTQEDLDRFSQKIVESNEDNRVRQESQKPEVAEEEKSTQTPGESHSGESEMDSLIESADKNLPLDEISANVIGKGEKEKRSKVLSKYKTLREKFARKEKKEKQVEELSSVETKESVPLKVSKVAENLLKQSRKSLDTKSEKEEKASEESGQTKVDTKDRKEEFVQARKEKTNEEQVTEKDVKKVKNSVDGVSVQKKEEKGEKNKSSTKENNIYPPIPHIEEKFRRFFTHYPPLKESDVWVEVVIKFLKNISKESYTDKDVEAFLEEFDYFVKRGDIVRASQVILLAGATDSQYAQFRLARELFSGKILQRNIEASFAIIKKLAEEYYPEAVCDLAQFYEYGLGVEKNKKVALKLYEKAFELGSVRASRHINRIKETNSGFLSSLLKLK